MRSFVLALFGLFFFINSNAQQLKFTVANNDWNADTLGNQRVWVHMDKPENIAKVTVKWRRSDPNPEEKGILIQDGKTGKLINNYQVIDFDREAISLCFEPTSGMGDYYIYYLPYRSEGRSNYPKGVYQKFSAGNGWLTKREAKIVENNATALEVQSINQFNSVYPMEVIATKKEVAWLKKKMNMPAFISFAESRINPIVMRNDIPQRWIGMGAAKSYKASAMRGENFSFQIGVFALKDLQNVKLEFSNLKGIAGTVSKSNFSCLNTDGTTYDNKLFVKQVDVPSNTVQAMWALLQFPNDVKAGKYFGKVTVTATNAPSQTFELQITINNQLAVNHNIAEPWKQTRLPWLNSNLAQENTVVAPYKPLEVSNNVISLLGRKVILNNDGFPKQIQTYFTPEMTETQEQPNDVLAEPIHFHFIDKKGNKVPLTPKGLDFTRKQAGTVTWTAINENDSLSVSVTGDLEFDGYLSYTVQVVAKQDVNLKDIAMHIPMAKNAATYMMGMGQKGGYRPETVNWKWDVANKNQDGAWLGNVNAGLQFSLRDERYVRPLNTNFYLQKPLLLPTSWGNDNKGGIHIGLKGSSMLVNSYSGERELKEGDTLYYNFNLLITPFHTINTNFQWENRFYHKYDKIEDIKEQGSTIINIHHATAINPWINYPFIEWKKMKSYIDSAHKVGLKVKIYNTVRELSNHAYETFPLRSLGHEVYSPGKGGGFSWLQEHVKDDYIAAWFVPEIKDAAIVNSGMSRWHNYYVEGMNWLVENVGIDGIYLDDVAFDRITMKRIKRVLTQDGHPGIIDLHSANQFNKSDGFNNSANLYMEHFPYLNRLWFGELFDYENNKPDFYLTEMSGIPFGLMGEMLQDGGNRWRGMVYGMTNRWPWEGSSNPKVIWKLWDEFGMQGSRMIGYWSPNCPVKTNDPNVLGTVYRRQGSILVALASWADEDVNIKLDIDWKKLAIDPSKASITIPEVEGYQEAKTLKIGDELMVPKGKGFMVWIKEN